MRTLIFGGPTLFGMDLSRWPGLERHGPVKHGDLHRAAPRSGDRVLIVDGVYQHYAPIRLKEILATLRAGVAVYGSSSMGALRAAEMSCVGMTGVGQVYEWYATGVLESDGDVAVAHAEADENYAPLTIPIVSLLHAAHSIGSLSPAEADRVTEHARTIPFSARSARALVQTSAYDRQLGAAMTAVCEYLAASWEHDVKRLDAVALLDSLDCAPARPPRPVARSLPVSAWESRWLIDESPPLPGAQCSAGELLGFCQLFLPDWRARHATWVRGRVQACDATCSIGQIARERGIWPDDAPTRASLTDRLGIPAGPPDEQLALVLVRTFRSGPGKFVYDAFPSSAFASDEVPELCELTARALSANALAESRHARFSHAQLAPDELYRVFSALWSEAWSEWCYIDRGFVSEADFLRSARPFFVAARAVAARRDADATSP